MYLYIYMAMKSSGLGLAIVRQICEMHNLDVQYRTNGLHCFEIRIKKQKKQVKSSAITLLLTAVNLLGLNAQERNIDFYLERAKVSSPLIYQAQNDKKIVSLDLQQVNRILYKPEINVVSGFTFSPIVSRDVNRAGFHLVSDGASDYFGHDLALTDGGHYQALVSLSQQLLNGSKYKVYVDQAENSAKINENIIVLTIHELEQVVSYQYLQCIRSSSEARNSKSLLSDLEEHYVLLRKLVEQGIYKQTDLMLLGMEMDNFGLEYKSLLDEYKTNLYDLNLICGITDTMVVELQDLDLRLNPRSPQISAFMASFTLDSLGILFDQAVNELKYKPQLNLFTDAGLDAAYLPSPRRLGVSAGLSLTWNIFDGHQRDIQREKSAVNLQTLEFRKNHFMTQNEICRNKVLGQISSVKERILLTEEKSDRYETLKEAYLKELSIGEASVMDIKNLLKDIAACSKELLQLRMEEQFLINNYRYLNF